VSGRPQERIAIGFRAKTGWAALVLLGASADGPQVLDARRIELCDPEDPDSRQPYHAGFGTFNEDDAEVKRLVRGVRRYAAWTMKKLLDEYAAAGRSPGAGAVVVGSTIDPQKIANLHMRAHALEGRLYREVVEEGLGAAGLDCEFLRERDLWLRAAKRLGTREDSLKKRVAAFGRAVEGGWRAENKAAAVAAWLALAGMAGRVGLSSN
jgi:hypothetical protein